MKVFVSCHHPMEKYRLNDELVELKQDRNDRKWFWSHPTFGCSKSYVEPESAIFGMLHDHGCWNVQVTIIKVGSPLKACQVARLLQLAGDIHEVSWNDEHYGTYTKSWEESLHEAGLLPEWAELLSPMCEAGYGELWDWAQNAIRGYPKE